MVSNILVTGGTGFIGYHLVKHLLKKGHTVTLVDNFFRSKQDESIKEIRSDIKMIEADLTNALNTLPLDKHYDVVFHLAAINGVKYANQMPDYVLRTNLLSTINVLDWCAEHKPDTVLFASSSEVYNNAYAWGDFPLPTSENTPLCIDVDIPRNAYAGSKLTGELLTLNYGKRHGFNTRMVRYHNIYGPRMGYDHVIPQLISRVMKKESPFQLYGADQTRAFSYVTDAVEATYEIGMLTEGHHTVNIGNANEEIAIRELCQKLFRLMNCQEPIVDAPPFPGSPDRRCPDTELLRRLTGLQPKVSLDEGLQHTLEWYLSNAMEKV